MSMLFDDSNGNFKQIAPRPCSDRALKLGLAVLGVVKADEALTRARREVPSYTGQHSSEDYYARETEDMYRACERLEQVIDAPEVIYERDDFIELRNNGAGRRFGIVEKVTSTGMIGGGRHVRYTVTLVNENGRVPQEKARSITADRESIIGLTTIQNLVQARQNKEFCDAYPKVAPSTK